MPFHPVANLNLAARRVLEYIRANIGEELRLSNLAAIAGMSPHYFCELFN